MRTVYCGDLNISNVGLKVKLCGWVNRHRNFANFIFIEIRDREGSVQVFVDANSDNGVFAFAMQLRNEYCLQVIGVVRERPTYQINRNMKTGDIEVLATDLKIISVSDPLPLDLHQENTEEQRLKYRYLDLRRPVMLQRLKNRSRVTAYIHDFMGKNGFLNIETPILTRSVPEGARDYLVPSRLHKGKFYALPQSPQLFKQLLMISGFDRYYQIIKCFRDEDVRSDRQPEFTQVDIETSFMTANEVRIIIEALICSLWYEILGVELKPFVQLTYKEVINRFASDHPDLRNPIEIFYISNISPEEIICNNFYNSLDEKNNLLKVMVMFVPCGAQLTCHEIDQYIDYFRHSGGENLTWIKINGVGCSRKIKGSGIHFFKFNVIERIVLETCLSEKDIVFLSCSSRSFLNSALSALRVKLGNDLHLIKKDIWKPLWVVDFPLFKRNKEGDIMSVHHLFTSPKNINVEFLIKHPLLALADSFDVVINGCEIGSGSVRIHSLEMQKTVFKILGFTEEFQNKNFGFLLNALRYGPPIHAGIACGLDRLVMLLSGTDNIRDVIAFPKTTNAVDLMIETPNFLDCNILQSNVI